MSGHDKRGERMTKEERLGWLKCIEKDIYVSSLESTFVDDSKSCAIHSIIEELEQKPCEEAISRKSLKEWLDLNFSFGGALEKLEFFKRLDKELPSIQPKQRWIPVSENLPEPLIKGVKRYITTIESGKVEIRYFSPSFGWNNDDVIAWMPFPEAYTEEKE